uniref:Uncharacterized protein n=1 Tax=Cyanothece sp. (strain PCC 7425 / ATCC 29141) TaxID=395961 RepID=B8HYX3_CYAP4
MSNQLPEMSRKHNKVVPDNVKVNDLMAFTYYGTIKSIQKDGKQLIVSGLDSGMSDFSIEGEELITNAHSADQYTEEEKVSKTKAAEILITSVNRPFTVCFKKKDGSERILRGRLVEPEPLLGRSHVEDLDIKDGDRLRQVDHRTLIYLIVDGVKYIVK